MYNKLLLIYNNLVKKKTDKNGSLTGINTVYPKITLQNISLLLTIILCIVILSE